MTSKYFKLLRDSFNLFNLSNVAEQSASWLCKDGVTVQEEKRNFLFLPSLVDFIHMGSSLLMFIQFLRNPTILPSLADWTKKKNKTRTTSPVFKKTSNTVYLQHFYSGIVPKAFRMSGRHYNNIHTAERSKISSSLFIKYSFLNINKYVHVHIYTCLLSSFFTHMWQGSKVSTRF